MKVSVIVATIHLGGLDVLFHSLDRQTMPKAEWELILVDANMEQRKEQVEDRRRMDYPGINLVHIPPKNVSEYFDASTSFNTGASVARGGLVVYMSDFLWAYPRYLEDHWSLYQNHPGYSMSGFADRFEFPPIANCSQGCCWWSCFRQEFDVAFAVDWFASHGPFYQERKFGTSHRIPGKLLFEVPGEYVYFSVNESIPLSVLKELNGFDERLNGAYGNNDRDLGARANMIGWKWMVNVDSVVCKMGNRQMAHSMLPGVKKKTIRSVEDNYAIVTQKLQRIAKGEESARTPNGWGIE